MTFETEFSKDSCAKLLNRGWFRRAASLGEYSFRAGSLSPIEVKPAVDQSEVSS